MKSVWCGPFEAERYWRDARLASLPFIRESGSGRLLDAMDEMLFVLSSPGDVVVTKAPMSSILLSYLHDIGFSFTNVVLTPDGETGNDDSSTLYEYGLRSIGVEQFRKDNSNAGRLEPFAVVPGIEAFIEQTGLIGRFPSQDVIRQVNAKSYSLRVRDALRITNVGETVDNLDMLLEHARRLLEHGPILLKDDFGVSGKGNLLVDSLRILQRIARGFAAQIEQGRIMRLIIEPFQTKQLDFSCQFKIDEQGVVSVISVQQLVNSGLAFGMSCTATAELMRRLEENRYFSTMRAIGERLYADGYWGDVCVDSMLLQDGTIAPLVEINARKSMSLIKHGLDRFLKTWQKHCSLTSVAAINFKQQDCSLLLAELERRRILFSPCDPNGILPLTSGTLYPAGGFPEGEPFRGRLYVAVVHDLPDERELLLETLREAMTSTGLQVPFVRALLKGNSEPQK